MLRAVLRTIVFSMMIVFTLTKVEPGAMTDNERYFSEARAQMAAFATEKEPERLREAYINLENVVLAQEPDHAESARLRFRVLSTWLELVATVDRFLDPDFDPEDVPEEGVEPPPTSEGVVYPPGADPAVIDDAEARAAYEKAIAANRAKAERYRLQSKLRQLDDRIMARAQAFIRKSYTYAPADREEVRATVPELVSDPRRQDELLSALVGSGR